jgi:uncharacterized protein (TIGR00251 family)
MRVRVHPGARRNGFRGFAADGALRVEVSAPPADGRANQAVEALLAETLGLKVRQVSVVRGATSRVKVVQIEGLTGSEAENRIRAALEHGSRHAE